MHYPHIHNSESKLVCQNMMKTNYTEVSIVSSQMHILHFYVSACEMRHIFDRLQVLKQACSNWSYGIKAGSLMVGILINLVLRLISQV